MNILYICNEYPPEPHGGVGTYVQTISHALVEQGHNVTVAGIYPSIQSSTFFSDNSVNVHKFPAGKVNNRFVLFSDRWRLSRLVSYLTHTEKIDLVEAPEGGGWSLFNSTTHPHVVRLHNTAPIYSRLSNSNQRGKLIHLFESIAIRRSTRIVSVSEYLLRQALDLYPLSDLKKRKPIVIYNGIDTSQFKCEPYEISIPGRIVYAGTIKPIKNIDKLLLAFCHLTRINNEAELHIFGKDTFIRGESYLKSIIDKLSPDVKLKVKYHGSVPFSLMPKIFSSAQLCVFPSAVESFGLVVAEAMSCGRPVIYTNHGPGPELITNGVDGFLCDPEDYQGVAELMDKIINSPNEGKMIGIRASETVKSKLDINIIADQNINFYINCIKNPVRT